MNEADVREEIAAPLLAGLGYQRGTENDIRREYPLTYDRVFLGRKKENDPPLRGRADYVLVVTGAARWVLETKGSNEEITRDAIDQALSYARHPEVAGVYTVIVNGIRLVVFHSSQTSAEVPRIDLDAASVPHLLAQLSGTLSPAAIRRDCSPPKVDLGVPLSEGLRSSAKIAGGAFLITNLSWQGEHPYLPLAKAQLDEICSKMINLRIPITGGEIRRDVESRIVAKLVWDVPHEELLRFVLDKHLLDVEYVSLSSTISNDPNAPTIFDVAGHIHIERNERLYDILRWQSSALGMNCELSYSGQATGFIRDAVFSGSFQSTYEILFPNIKEGIAALLPPDIAAFVPDIPDIVVDMATTGTLDIRVDPR